MNAAAPPARRVGRARGRVARALAVAAALLAGCSGPELYVENDFLGLGRGSDRHYTNGVRFQNTITRADAPGWIRGVAGAMRPFEEEEPTEIGFILGHHIYTPGNLKLGRLIRDDRPYAGWAYGGLMRVDADFEASGGSDDQTMVEVLVGLIGPDTQAEELQRSLHRLIGSDNPKGWHHQLDDEATLMWSYERRNRAARGSLGAIDLDLILHGSASLGTPFTGAEVGSTGRIGWNLPRDFGLSLNEPALANTAVSRKERNPHSFYFFVGAAGRGVVLNTFLDGNTFEHSHSVDKKPFVGDLVAGFATQVGRFRFSYAWAVRTREFEQQRNENIFGSLSVSWTESR